MITVFYIYSNPKKFKQITNSAKKHKLWGHCPVLWTPLLPFRSPKGKRKGQLALPIPLGIPYAFA